MKSTLVNNLTQVDFFLHQNALEPFTQCQQEDTMSQPILSVKHQQLKQKIGGGR